MPDAPVDIDIKEIVKDRSGRQRNSASITTSFDRSHLLTFPPSYIFTFPPSYLSPLIKHQSPDCLFV